MTSGNHRAGSAIHPCTRLRLHHTGVMRTGLAVLALALAACQQARPAIKDAPSSEEPASQADSASGFVLPRPSAIVKELSARSRIPTSELQELLSDCDRTQLSMNICTFRNFVALDLELDAALEAKRESVAPECRAKIDRAHAAWAVERDRACDEETELDKGGSMRPMLISDCKADATKERILIVKEMDSCR